MPVCHLTAGLGRQVTALLAGAVGGLHTMRDEHFGISVVQYMAAGAQGPSPGLRSGHSKPCAFPS